MIFGMFNEFGAMNSGPVFGAFQSSLDKAGVPWTKNINMCNVAVIWSVLWNGRMARNKEVWDHCKANNKPIIVLEVGGLQRNQSWKVAIDGINREAYFGEGSKSSVNNWLRNASKFRQKKFDLDLQPWRETANNKYILICTQHNKSHQWRSMPPVDQWLEEQIKQIRKHTSRDIKIRPHPRSPIDPSTIRQLNFNYKNVDLQYPKRYQQTYDEFDFDAALDGAHCVISHSSNPGLQAVVAGVPVFVGKESLAYDVSNKDYSRIENLHKPDRLIWFNNLLYTEYFIDEIADGLPLVRLLPRLEKLVLAQNT
jgi:hypothetical protein